MTAPAPILRSSATVLPDLVPALASVVPVVLDEMRDRLVTLSSFVSNTSTHALSVGGVVHGPVSGATEQAVLAALDALVDVSPPDYYAATVEGTGSAAHLRIAAGPAVVAGTRTVVAAGAARTTPDGPELDAPRDYLLDEVEGLPAHRPPCCVVVPRPTQASRREWATPQSNDGVAAAVLVVIQPRTSVERAALVLGYQRVIDVALARIDRAATLAGVWRIQSVRPLSEPVGVDRNRRAAGQEARLFTRVTREEVAA